jgi:hypothetical protein
VEVPTAIGPVRNENQPPRLVADLGPADRLAVRWQDVVREEAPVSLDADQLLWLKVQPGAVWLDAKLKLKVAAGHLRRLQITADPLLELLPLSGDGAPTVQVRRPAGQSQLIEFRWPRPIADETVIEARFLACGASGMGRVRVPHLEVPDARPARRWLAVSLDPGLKEETALPRRLESVPVTHFTKAWDKADNPPAKVNPPSKVYVLPPGPIDCSFSFAPCKVESTADQTLVLTCGPSDVEVRFDAALLSEGGPVFQQTLSAPAELEVEQVAVKVEGADRRSRWVEDGKGAITVFFSRPVSGRHSISLHGRMPARLGQKTALPWVSMKTARTQSQTVRVLRRSSVLVGLEALSYLSESKEAAGDKAGPLRLVRAMTADPGATPGGLLVVSLNQPQLHADQTTRVFWEEGQWKAAVHCRLHRKPGEARSLGPYAVDELCFDVPASWDGPYKVTPPMKDELTERPGGGRRLVLRPAVPISADCEVTISAPLDFSPSDPILTPEVVLRSVQYDERRMVVPRKVQGQALAWVTQGLQELPPPAAKRADDALVYAVAEEPGMAVLPAGAAASEEGRVRLADVRLAWQADGTCHGAAAFDVEPGKLTHCPLWLPGDCRLVQTTLAGTPVDPLPAPGGGWLVPLTSEPAVQRLEVLFTTGESDMAGWPESPAETPSGPALSAPAIVSPPASVLEVLDRRFSLSGEVRRRFHAPRLGDLAVLRTQWSVAGPSWAGPSSPEDAERPDSGPEPLVRVSEQGDTWLRGELPVRWQTALDGSQAVVRCEMAGRCHALVLRYRPAAADALSGRVLGAAVWASLLGFAVVLVRRGALWRCFARWPHALGVALGLAWWLWLWPSVLGLVIVAVVLFSHFAPWLRKAAA